MFKGDSVSLDKKKLDLNQAREFRVWLAGDRVSLCKYSRLVYPYSFTKCWRSSVVNRPYTEANKLGHSLLGP